MRLSKIVISFIILILFPFSAYSGKDCVTCTKTTVEGAPNPAFKETLGLAYLERCSTYSQISSKDSVRVFFNNIKENPQMDEWLTKMRCGLDRRGDEGGILWNSTHGCEAKSLMIVALYNHYKKRNRLDVFEQILNGTNKRGMTFLDFMETNSRYSSYTRGLIKPMKDVLCKYGGKHKIYPELNKTCIKEI